MSEVPNYKWLEIVLGRRGRRPVIKGTHVAVDDVLEALSSRWSIEEVAEIMYKGVTDQELFVLANKLNKTILTIDRDLDITT